MTQVSQMPTVSVVSPNVRDILEPFSNEQSRATYLERQMRDMSSFRLPSDIPSLEDGVSIRHESLSKRIQNYCWEKRDKRKHAWEIHRLALEGMKESKEKQWQQQSQEESDAVYAKMLQNLERTRAGVRNSISKECQCQLTLTENDFLVIQWKMDMIDQRLTDLYRNWQAEYKDAITLDECEERRRYYKPYLEKYESKYRILYQMLQQANKPIGQTSLLSTQKPTSGITPSLAVLDDTQSLGRKKWKRGEPGKLCPDNILLWAGIWCQHHLNVRT